MFSLYATTNRGPKSIVEFLGFAPINCLVFVVPEQNGFVLFLGTPPNKQNMF